MEMIDFTKLKMRFMEASVEEKVNIYATTEGLTQHQYKELLKVFPMNQIHLIEKALS